PVALDEDLVVPVAHDLCDGGVGQRRVERPVPERVAHDFREEPLALDRRDPYFLAPEDPVEAGFDFLLEGSALQRFRAGKLGPDLRKHEVTHLALRIAPLVRGLLDRARGALSGLGDGGWNFLAAS